MVSTGEAAHPAVTSVKWSQLSMFRTYEAWFSLLHITSPPPEIFTSADYST